MKKVIIIYFLGLSVNFILAQKEAYNWCYGNYAGLCFTSTPVSQFSNSAMAVVESCASISDPSGNLLFYSDGVTVYNASHTVMANGNGIWGHISTTQGAVIVKQPGNSSIYFLFTPVVSNYSVTNNVGLRYSTIDMSLAAGMGSVTSKNILLHNSTSEKCVAVRHCNGIDAWVVTHDIGSNTFRANLITAAGVNTAAVLSNVGTNLNDVTWSIGQMKISPNGKKLGLAITNEPGNGDAFELYDFDNNTGLVSNQLVLGGANYIYGCEFSPDGTKFYGGTNGSSPYINKIYQWDLCAGSNSAIVASQYTALGYTKSFQRAPDGKIYIATGDLYLSGIASPNNSGVNCMYTSTVQGLFPTYSSAGLPNFINTDLKLNIPFTFTNACNSFSFSSLPSIGNTCAYAANTINALKWLFGDPNSGSANSSTLNAPTHYYNNGGTYTVQLILQYNCSNDTITQTVQVNVPQINISGKTTICKNEKMLLTASGANSYSWNTGASTATIAATPSTTIVYTVTGTNTNQCSASKIVTVNVNPCLNISEEINKPEILIFPNPSKGLFNFVTDQNADLKIYNQLGNLVDQINIVKGNNSINLQHLSNGLYFTEINSKNLKLIYKIFKEE